MQESRRGFLGSCLGGAALVFAGKTPSEAGQPIFARVPASSPEPIFNRPKDESRLAIHTNFVPLKTKFILADQKQFGLVVALWIEYLSERVTWVHLEMISAGNFQGQPRDYLSLRLYPGKPDRADGNVYPEFRLNDGRTLPLPVAGFYLDARDPFVRAYLSGVAEVCVPHPERLRVPCHRCSRCGRLRPAWSLCESQRGAFGYCGYCGEFSRPDAGPLVELGFRHLRRVHLTPEGASFAFATEEFRYASDARPPYYAQPWENPSWISQDPHASVILTRVTDPAVIWNGPTAPA